MYIEKIARIIPLILILYFFFSTIIGGVLYHLEIISGKIWFYILMSIIGVPILLNRFLPEVSSSTRGYGGGVGGGYYDCGDGDGGEGGGGDGGGCGG